VDLDPDAAAAWNSLGFALDELGRPQEALAAYENALRADRGYWPAAHNLGLARLRNGDPGGAATAFEEVLRRQPGHVDAHFQLTLLFAGPLADPRRALEHLDGCLRSAPDHPRARQLGELRARLLAVL
jgi:tetratricopeptide (TPR) repeat protein